MFFFTKFSCCVKPIDGQNRSITEHSWSGTGALEAGTYIINDNSVSSVGIQMRKEQITISALAVWLILISVFMVLAQRVSLEIFFVLSFLGFLILLYLISPEYIQPSYLRYIHYILVVGIVIFGAIVTQKVLEILGFEIVF
jgi:hypothetical protein